MGRLESETKTPGETIRDLLGKHAAVIGMGALLAAALSHMLVNFYGSRDGANRSGGNGRPSSNAWFAVAVGLTNLSAEVRQTSNAVRLLTAEDVLQKHKELVARTEALEKQLASLQQIISPSNASEILTVARMKDEILARKEFEKRISESVDRAETNLQALLWWLIGVAGSIITFLGSAVVFLLVRSARLYRLVETLQSEPRRRGSAI
jgi:hypothetical protein